MRKPRKTTLSINELLQDPDKKIEDARDTPTTIWRSQLGLRRITPMMFNRILEDWMKRQPETASGKNMSSTRSNQVAAATNKYMTWKQMVKFFKMLNYKTITVSFTVRWHDDQITRTTVNLAGSEDEDLSKVKPDIEM